MEGQKRMDIRFCHKTNTKAGDLFFFTNCPKTVFLNWKRCVSPIKSHSKQFF